MARPPLAKLARRRLRVEEDDDNDNRPAQLAAAGLGAAGVTATGLALANYQRKARAAQRAQAAAAPAAPAAPAAAAPAAGGGRGRAVAGGLAGLAALLGLGGLGAHAYNKRNNIQVQHTGHAAVPAALPAAPAAAPAAAPVATPAPAPAAASSHTPTLPGIGNAFLGHEVAHAPTLPNIAAVAPAAVAAAQIPGGRAPGTPRAKTSPGLGGATPAQTPGGRAPGTPRAKTSPGLGGATPAQTPGGRGLSDDTFDRMPTLPDFGNASLNPPGTAPARRPSGASARNRTPLAETLPPASLAETRRYPALAPAEARTPLAETLPPAMLAETRRYPALDPAEARTQEMRTVRRPALDPAEARTQEMATRRFSDFDAEDTQLGRTLRRRQRVAIGPPERRKGGPPTIPDAAVLQSRALDARRAEARARKPQPSPETSSPYGYSPAYIAEAEALGARLRASEEARQSANGTRYAPGNETNPRISGAPVSSDAVGGTRFQASPYETQQLGRAIASAGPMGNRQVTQPNIAPAAGERFRLSDEALAQIPTLPFIREDFNGPEPTPIRLSSPNEGFGLPYPPRSYPQLSSREQTQPGVGPSPLRSAPQLSSREQTQPGVGPSPRTRSEPPTIPDEAVRQSRALDARQAERRKGVPPTIPDEAVRQSRALDARQAERRKGAPPPLSEAKRRRSIARDSARAERLAGGPQHDVSLVYPTAINERLSTRLNPQIESDEALSGGGALTNILLSPRRSGGIRKALLNNPRVQQISRDPDAMDALAHGLMASGATRAEQMTPELIDSILDSPQYATTLQHMKTGSLKTAAARRVYRVKVSGVRKVLSHYKLGNLKAADIDKLIRGNIMSVGGSDRQTPAEEASLADRLSRVFHAADSSGSPSASESSHGSLPMSGTATV